MWQFWPYVTILTTCDNCDHMWQFWAHLTIMNTCDNCVNSDHLIIVIWAMLNKNTSVKFYLDLWPPYRVFNHYCRRSIMGNFHFISIPMPIYSGHARERRQEGRNSWVALLKYHARERLLRIRKMLWHSSLNIFAFLEDWCYAIDSRGLWFIEYEH